MDSWREILGRVIEDPKEKRRLADEIGILDPRTLERWYEGISTPKNSQIIRKLNEIVSLAQPEMDEALRNAFPDIFKHPLPSTPQSIEVRIPYEFISRALHAYTTVPRSMGKWTVSNLVLDQMIHHLDPAGAGIAIVFVQRVPSALTFLLQEGGGSGAWDTRQLLSQGKLEGASFSWLNTVVITGKPHFIQSLPNSEATPILEYFMQKDEIKALAVYPVQRGGTAAGVLLICARWEDFFTSPRRKLLDGYTQLFSLAFSDAEFSTDTVI